MALLSFISLGATDTDPEFGNTVRLAVTYLASSAVLNQSGQVLIDSNSPADRFYSQGIYTLAMSDAAYMLTDTQLRQTASGAAQLAFNHLLSVQPSTGGYAYSGGGSDTSVSGWCYQAFASALKAGLSSSRDPYYMTKVNLWLDRVKNSDGSSGYSAGSTTRAFRMTPVALTCRLLLGHTPDEAACKQQMAWMESNDRSPYPAGSQMYKTGDTGTGGASSNVCQIYYVYYATLARYLMGDAEGKAYWSGWKASMPPAVEAARTSGTMPLSGQSCSSGYVGKQGAYWPTSTDSWLGNYGGVEFTTALACMAQTAAYGESLPGSKWYKAGAYSYGYNKLLGLNRRDPAKNTIVLMDYTRWGIDSSDPEEYVVPRHGHKVNILTADGRVESKAVCEIVDPATQKIKRCMLTLEADN